MNIGNNSGSMLNFPSQKIADGKKTKQWFIDCIESAKTLSYDSEWSDKKKMQVYHDLDNDIIDEEEVEKVFNPLDIEYSVFPAAMKNYPLSVPKIDLLQGEELKRTYDYVVRSKNETAYSSHQSDTQKMLMEILMDELVSDTYDEKDAEARIKKFSKYIKYEWKDTHELTATRILEYLYREQSIQAKFNEGFRDALVMGQEIYRIDSIGGEPSVVKVDPRKVYAIRKGSSSFIEDADIILEVDYLSPGEIIDEFYDYLKPTEVSKIEDGKNISSNAGGNVLNYKNKYPPIYSNLQAGPNGEGFHELKDFVAEYNLFTMPYDYYGNVRVIRARWKGRRKIGRLSYFDEEGNEQETLVPDSYKINEELGETVKWLWINEAYEGTLIADDIYVKYQTREVQMRHFDNISKCFLGYVGTDYGKSLMSRMEPYQYLYNVYMRRLELVLSKYKGPIYELDISKVPDEWDMDKWLYYADALGWAIVDPFNEGKKGASTGKLSGNFNTTGKVLDPNVGNYIQQIVMMLQYIETQMGEIAGVTKQRQGQVDNRETVGGVERAVTQSSHITEKWFFVHDETKRRVLHALLDTAKYTWKKINSKKLNYVLDDLSRIFLEIDPSEIASSEFDLFVSNSRKDMELKQTIQQLAQAGIQNGLGMSAMIQALREDSVISMARTIETAEEESFQRSMEADRQNQQTMQMQVQAQVEKEEKDRELEYYKADLDAQVEREKIAAKEGEGNDDIDQQKIDLQRNKQSLEERRMESDRSIKEREVREKERSNRAKENKTN